MASPRRNKGKRARVWPARFIDSTGRQRQLLYRKNPGSAQYSSNQPARKCPPALLENTAEPVAGPEPTWQSTTAKNDFQRF